MNQNALWGAPVCDRHDWHHNSRYLTSDHLKVDLRYSRSQTDRDLVGNVPLLRSSRKTLTEDTDTSHLKTDTRDGQLAKQEIWHAFVVTWRNGAFCNSDNNACNLKIDSSGRGRWVFLEVFNRMNRFPVKAWNEQRGNGRLWIPGLIRFCRRDEETVFGHAVSVSAQF